MAEGNVDPTNLINARIPVVFLEYKWIDNFGLTNEEALTSAALTSGAIPVSTPWQYTNNRFYSQSPPIYTVLSSAAGAFISGTTIINPGCKNLMQDVVAPDIKILISGKNIYGFYGLFAGTALTDAAKDFLYRMMRWSCRSCLTQSV